MEQSLFASFVVEMLVSQWSINPYLSMEDVGALNSHIFQPKWCRDDGEIKERQRALVKARGEVGRAISYHTSVFWPLVLAMMDSKAEAVYCHEQTLMFMHAGDL